MTVKFMIKETPIGDVFVNLGNALNDKERQKVLLMSPESSDELMALISTAKRFAWGRLGGVDLITPEKSYPASDALVGVEFASRQI